MFSQFKSAAYWCGSKTRDAARWAVTSRSDDFVNTSFEGLKAGFTAMYFVVVNLSALIKYCNDSDSDNLHGININYYSLGPALLITMLLSWGASYTHKGINYQVDGEILLAEASKKIKMDLDESGKPTKLEINKYITSKHKISFFCERAAHCLDGAGTGLVIVVLLQNLNLVGNPTLSTNIILNCVGALLGLKASSLDVAGSVSGWIKYGKKMELENSVVTDAKIENDLEAQNQIVSPIEYTQAGKEIITIERASNSLNSLDEPLLTSTSFRKS